MKRIQASKFEPPEGAWRLSQSRTQDILKLWSVMVPLGPVNLQELAQSCYLQGIADTAEVLFRRGIDIETPIVLAASPNESTWEGYCG